MEMNEIRETVLMRCCPRIAHPDFVGVGGGRHTCMYTDFDCSDFGVYGVAATSSPILTKLPCSSPES